MATATKEVVPAVYKIILTLTEKEAEFLRSVFHCIGGCPTKSRRRHSKDLDAALCCAGVVGPKVDNNFKVIDVEECRSVIWFEDEEQ
jgi:hypothetical protein